MWYVYILKSETTNFIYVGSTNNLARRLADHNKGLVRSTKPYRPFTIIAYVAVQSQRQAIKLEKYFKTGSGRAVLYKRILGSNPLSNEALA